MPGTREKRIAYLIEQIVNSAEQKLKVLLNFFIFNYKMNIFEGKILLYIERGEKVETRELVEKAKGGDKEALIKLIMNKKQDYYKLAYVYMKNQEDALDALSDMIVILYENIHGLKRDEAFYSWSKTILINCCKKMLNKRKQIIYLENIREVEETQEQEELIEYKHQEILIESYLSRLKAKHQEVIKLRYFLDLDYESISDILKIPIGTVKSRISIGLKKLKESLGGEEL